MKRGLLLLHGAIGSKEQLKPSTKQLQHNFDVHLLNFAGHGGDADMEHFAIEVFAGQTMQYIQRNNLAPVVIFGYNMGGYVAMYLAVHQPCINYLRLYTGHKILLVCGYSCQRGKDAECK